MKETWPSDPQSVITGSTIAHRRLFFGSFDHRDEQSRLSSFKGIIERSVFSNGSAMDPHAHGKINIVDEHFRRGVQVTSAFPLLRHSTFQ